MINLNKEKLISLNNVSVAYQQRHRFFKTRDFWAIKNLTFDLYKGEGIGIIGRNGAGKSTLLRLLAGLVNPDEGYIVNYGARVSLLAIQAGFIPYLDAKENAILGLMFLGMSRSEAITHVPGILEFAELGHFAGEPLKNYSTGMKARLGFAVAFEAKPDVLLVDEAAAVGDAYFRKKSEAHLKEKFAGTASLVLVSHSSGMLRELTQKVIWLEHGQLVKIGDTEKIMDEYGPKK